MKNGLLTFLGTTLLSGCLLSVVHAQDEMDGEQLSRLMEETTQVSAERKIDRSAWQIKNCEASMKSADITLATDGRLSGGKLLFKLSSDVEFKEVPRVLLTSNKYFYPTLEGTNRIFSFDLPYELPHQVRRLIKQDSAFVVNYSPRGSEYEYRAIFPTGQLSEITQVLDQTCF